MIDQLNDQPLDQPPAFNQVVSNDYRQANAKAHMVAIRKLIKACTLEGAPYLDKRLGRFYSANLITERQLNKLDDELRQHLENIHA